MCIQWWIKNLRGMSDLCLYELQDNVWDEFGENDDHIVPRPTNETGEQGAIQSGSHKKLRVEVGDAASNAESASNFVILGKREVGSQTLTKRDKMLDKSSWSNGADDVFASCEGDSMKEATGMVPGDSGISSHCFNSDTSSELCTTDPIMGDRSTTIDNNLYHYSLSHISQAESNISFFDNGDKEGNDLYYGWPDIGNFEDVDKMFRSCDSTFGLGSLNNDDDLSWFSPPNAIEGSEDALKSGFKFSCSESTVLRSDSENQRVSGPDTEDNLVHDSKKKSATLRDNLSSQTTCVGESASFDGIQSVNGSEPKSESKEDSVPQEENLQRKQLKLQNQLEVKKKDKYQENGGGSFQHYGLPEHILDTKIPYGDPSEQIHDYVNVDFCHNVNQISECPSLSSIKCESNGNLTSSPKESSYASNQVQTTDSPHGSSFDVPNGKLDGKEKLQNRQQLQASAARNFNHLNVTSPTVISDPVAVLKQVHQNDNDADSQSEGRVTTEIDPSLVRECSSMSSILDEVSVEATSFHQLQQVMGQLDIRTKLCIRDSLYRLARSAEQRHNSVNPSSTTKSEGGLNGVEILDGSNKCNGFMDMETDTNPIDRSVAHLLFHRPLDASIRTGTGTDALSPKTHITIHRSVTNTPSKNDQEKCAEETGAELDKSPRSQMPG